MNFLMQSKLNKSEWESIEKPITNLKEKNILKMISNGYNEEDYTIVNCTYINDYLKVDKIYNKYSYYHLFQSTIDEYNSKNILNIESKYLFNETEILSVKGKNKLPKDVIIKVNNSIQKLINNDKNNIVEYQILDNIKTICKYFKKNKTTSKSKKKSKENQNLIDESVFHNKKVCISFYNLNFLVQNHSTKLHTIIFEISQNILKLYLSKISFEKVLQNVSYILESNNVYDTIDNTLHKHQKNIYNIFKTHKEPKMIMYCAPTSSGKTLTPLGISSSYKVIFVCASKHIGLSLAKSAFSVGKKIGFAFGCNDTDHIRLNFNAINSWIKTKDGRQKPDHNDGKRVEIMITDLKSYEYAMLYMKAFNKVDDMVMFWDEPTIGLDVKDSPIHEIIQYNWKINKIYQYNTKKNLVQIFTMNI